MFSALPDAGPLLLAADPAWIWSSDGSRVLWANPAGGRLLDAANFDALASRRWPPAHPLRREIEGLGRSLSDKGSLARLRIASDLRALPVACRCRRLRAGEERGILAVMLDGAGGQPSLPDLASFFSGGDGAAAILEESGAMLAVGAPASPGALAMSGAHAVFDDAGRRLRIEFLDLTPPTIAEPAAESEPEQEPAPPPAESPPVAAATTVAEEDELRPLLHRPSRSLPWISRAKPRSRARSRLHGWW